MDLAVILTLAVVLDIFPVLAVVLENWNLWVVRFLQEIYMEEI